MTIRHRNLRIASPRRAVSHLLRNNDPRLAYWRNCQQETSYVHSVEYTSAQVYIYVYFGLSNEILIESHGSLRRR